MRVVALFDNFGPYHYARLNELSTICNLLAVEIFGVSDEYSWERTLNSSLSAHTLSDYRRPDRYLLRDLEKLITEFDPDAIFIPGYYKLIHLHLAIKFRDRQIFLFSESQVVDFKRNFFVESIKGAVLDLFDGVLVGGSRHAAYLKKLKYPMDRVEMGYDVVDNEYFSGYLNKTPPFLDDAPHLFFLTVARLVPKKNLEFLLREYKAYREEQGRLGCVPFELRILGDGPLEGVLRELVEQLSLVDVVHMHGFVQYPDVPAYMYGAVALVHPSYSEQWGLVVNEAMCCGLPVIVSEKVGSSADLVVSGGNGYVFDPVANGSLSRVLCEFSALSEERRVEFSKQSVSLIGDWSLARFSESANKLMMLPKKRRNGLKFLLGLLCYGFYYLKDHLNSTEQG